jgi:aryl-alcohol dehydrogenase-like predicted oxidoreductase
MQYRRLGRSSLQVSPLCLGGNVFGWTADERTSFAILDAWVEAGFNFVDTADVYSKWAPGHSGGESETVIGRWLKQGGGRREKLVIATKVGFEMGEGKACRPNGSTRRWKIRCGACKWIASTSTRRTSTTTRRRSRKRWKRSRI